MNKIEHLPINWADGLKLRAEHLVENYFSILESNYRTVSQSLTNYNYGLGDALENSGESIEIEISGMTVDTLSVHLKSCNALTRSGIPILFYDGLYGDYIPSATMAANGYSTIGDNAFYILVSVNPYRLIPVGEPDPDEVPLRHPNVLPEIGMHLVPKNQVNKAFYNKNFLIVGEIQTQGNSFSVNRQYIPPLQKSAYHDGVRSFLNQLNHTLHAIRDDIRLIYNRNISDKRRDILANNTFVLCEAFNSFYNSRIFYLEQIAEEQPPIFIVQAINELANKLASALQTISETEREELLQYYYEWTDITPSDFMRDMENVVSLKYNHTEIIDSLNVSGAFITLLRKMFHKMSELEYIGLVRENIVMGEEHKTPLSLQKKKRWFFME